MAQVCRECQAQYGGAPGSGRCLGHLDGMHLLVARCGIDGKRYTRPAYEFRHRLVLPRSGAYLLQVNGRETLVDTSAAILTRPGDELRIAHPLGCGDTFLQVEIDPELSERWPRTAFRFPVDDATDLDHRALVAACRRGFDALAVGERLFSLFDRLTPPADGHRRARPSTGAAHRRLVADARAVLVDGGYAYSLNDLAARVNCSPHHLSRTFRAVTGETLTEHRNRMRIRAVLNDLQEGADCLRTLAARYGFADQSHLTRVVRRHLGRAPSRVREMLAGDRA